MFALSSAVNRVIETLHKTDHGARVFILDQICKLEDCDFCQSVVMTEEVYDEYGKIIDEIPWYIKLAILEEDKEEFISCISFHPLEKDMKTVSGIIKKF